MIRPRASSLFLASSLLLISAAYTVPVAVPSNDCFDAAWKIEYPFVTPGGTTSYDNASCLLCHGDCFDVPARGEVTLNPYGWDLFLAAGTKSQRLNGVEPLDSDGDGFTNTCEITNGTQPGWAEGLNETVILPGDVTCEVEAPTDSIVGLLAPTEVQVASRSGVGTVDCLTSINPPIIGANWTLEVDSTAVDNASSVFIICFSGRLDPGIVFPAGELLVDVTSAFFFREGQAANPLGPNVFSTSLLPDVQIVGVQGTTQAAVINNSGVAKLTNALDVVLGYPVCSHGGGGGGGGG